MRVQKSQENQGLEFPNAHKQLGGYEESSEYRVNLAHLILCHNEFEIIKRLAIRLSGFSDVFIYVDAKSDGTWLEKELKEHRNVFFVKSRKPCYWSGYSEIEAEIEMLRLAAQIGSYDRYVFLEAPCYPIKSNRYIVDFFGKNPDVEFIRACNVSHSDDWYFQRKSKGLYFYDKRNIVKKIFNHMTDTLKIKLKNGRIKDGGKVYEVFWGSASWSFTGEFAKYVLNFHDSHEKLNRWFKHAFCPAESYFHTIIMNSEFAERTTMKGSEATERGLVNWKNLVYFEYGSEIRVWNKDDYDYIEGLDELYIRKCTLESSAGLLDMLDEDNDK